MSNKLYGVLIILALFCLSCGKDKEPIDLPMNPVLKIELGDSITLSNNDIAFYDSATRILFLKDEVKIKVGVGSPPTECTKFRIFADSDTLVKGVLFPDFEFNSVPPGPIYISSKTYPVFQSNILQFMRGSWFVKSNQFIEAFKDNNLLRNGITCTIDSIKKTTGHDSIVSCKITYTNFDPVAYYVPDPGKMDGYFNSWGLFSLRNKQTQQMLYSTSDKWITSAWNWELSHLTLLPAMGQISFEYTTSLSDKVTPGDYGCYFSLNNNLHFLPFPIPLDQNSYRVWVGGIRTTSSIKIK